MGEAVTRRKGEDDTHSVARRAQASEAGRVKTALAVVACVVLSCVALVALARGGAGATATRTESIPTTFAAAPVAVQGGAFSHATSGHNGACASCHTRAGGDSLRLPGHKACTSCHMPQFISSELSLCATCHTDMNSPDPPRKPFPPLRSFNAKFDHAQHNTGGALPPSGCATCHTGGSRRSGALSIPAGLAAHSTCFQCHTPGAQSGGRDISSCGVCHELGSYSPTPAAGRAFRASFTHAAHGPRQGMNCATCHGVRAGAGQGRQVSSPLTVQHLAPTRAQSCQTCHNEKRAFGGDDFADCRRCHRGQTFRF